MKGTSLLSCCNFFWLRLLLLILLVLFPVSRSVYAKPPHKAGADSTEQLTVEAGTNATLSCNLRDLNQFLTPGNNSVKEFVLAWKWKPVTNTTKWITLPDNSTITLLKNREDSSLSNLTKKSIKLKLRNVTISMSGLYACFLSAQDVPLNQIDLQVGYAPEKLPSYLYCNSNGLVTMMNCSWNLRRQSNIPTTYELSYTVKRKSSILNIQHAEKSVRNTTCIVSNATTLWDDKIYDDRTSKAVFCSLNITLSDHRNFGPLICNITVIASNYLGNETIVKDEYPESVVKTNPPTNVTINNSLKAANATSSHLLVSWDAPANVKDDIKIEYIISYRQTNATDGWKEESVYTTTRCLLTDLEPYTRYDVQVKAIPAHDFKNNILYSGSPSEYTPVVTCRTSRKVPVRPLFFSEINITRFYLEDDFAWKISLKWIVYNLHDQPGFYYDILYVEALGGRQQFQFHQNHASFNVSGETSANLLGRHCTNVGCSPFSDPALLNFYEDIPAIENVQLSLSDKATFTWEKPVEIGDEDTCIARLCTFYRRGSDFTGIFHNHEDANRIDDYNQSTSVFCVETSASCSDGKANLTVDISPCYYYMANVLRVKPINEIQKLLISSKVSGSTSDTKIIPRSSTFDAKDNSDGGHYQINTSWNFNQSEELPKDNHLQFSVVYSPRNKAKTFESYHEPVVNSTQTKLMISSNVHEATEYDLGLGYCCPSIPTHSRGFCFAAADEVAAVTTVSDHSAGTSFASLMVGLSFATVMLLIILVLAQYYRKSIKSFIRKHFWPKVPVPDIYIQFFAESSQRSFDSNRNNVKDLLYNNKHLDIDSSPPAAEVPDDITDYNKENIKENDDQTKEEPAPKSKLNVSNSELPLAEYAPNEEKRSGLLAQVDKIARPGAKRWRNIFYPSLQNYSSSSTRKERRPHSYAGNVTTSFDEASYLRETSENGTIKNHNITRNQDPFLPVTYSKLALNPKGKLKFVNVAPSCNGADQNGLLPNGRGFRKRNLADVKQESEATSSVKETTRDLQGRRSESWYDSDFLPFASALPLLDPNRNSDISSFASDQQDYVGTTASYVIVPTDESAAQDEFLLSDQQNDLDLSLNLQCPSQKNDVPRFGNNSNSWHPRLQRNASVEAPRPDEHNFTANLCDSLDVNDSDGASQEADLLTYIQEKESYVTIGEALHLPEQTNEFNENIKRTFNDTFTKEDLNDMTLSDFHENDSSDLITMSSALSRLLDDATSINYDIQRNNDEFYDVDDGAYVAEVEATRLCA